MIYVTGDTHGEVFERVVSLKKSYDLTKEHNILIVLGDFGLVWDEKWWKQAKYIERYIKDNNLKLEIISVKGNHENYDIINKLPRIQKYNSELIKVSENISFFENGNIYHIGEDIFAVFGGALSIDKMYRKEGKTWWADEIPSKETMQKFVDNLDKYNTKKLILLTHTTSTDNIYLLDKYPMTDNVASFLSFIKNNYDFKSHYFGHFHMDKFIHVDTSCCLFKTITTVGSKAERQDDKYFDNLFKSYLEAKEKGLL